MIYEVFLKTFQNILLYNILLQIFNNYNCSTVKYLSIQCYTLYVCIRPKGPGDDAPSTFRSFRPSLPVAPPFTQHVKPVNEEPEEEDVARDSTRERDDDDSRDRSHEPESEEVSEENLPPRPAPNPARTPPGGGAPAPVLYRPAQPVTPSSIRTSPATPPPPPPVQYRPTQKPTKAPRKQVVDDTYKQPIKPPPKPVKPSQAYEIRGKKPVAQVRAGTVETVRETEIIHEENML